MQSVLFKSKAVKLHDSGDTKKRLIGEVYFLQRLYISLPGCPVWRVPIITKPYGLNQDYSHCQKYL